MDKTATIFSSALIAVILFICPFTVPREAGNPQLPSPPDISNLPNASASASPPENASPSDKAERDWAMITKENVESACLSEAKKEAVAEGYSEGMVFGCACSARESAGAKSYECSVSALDGEHLAGIVCTKSGMACTITTQQGEATYTFEQLQALANQ